jgi:predicted nucleotidyltransferase
MNYMDFRVQTLNRLVQDLQDVDGVLAVWEGGSAANSTTDQYSDIDVNVMGDGNSEVIFATVESALKKISPMG